MKHIFKIIAAALTLQALAASRSLAQNADLEEFSDQRPVISKRFYVAQKEWLDIKSEFESGDNPFYDSVCTQLNLDQPDDPAKLAKLSIDKDIVHAPEYCRKNLAARIKLDVRLEQLRQSEKSASARLEVFANNSQQTDKAAIEKSKQDSLKEIHEYMAAENIALKLGYAKRMYSAFSQTFPYGIMIRTPY